MSGDHICTGSAGYVIFCVMDGKIYGFPPVSGAAPRVLILGSMPSVRSLQKAEYYGHPRNHFWKILSALLQTEEPSAYEDRLQMLRDSGIALWDVVESCRREGSLDQSIQDAEYNDTLDFIRRHPSLKLVCFNGAKAERGFWHMVADEDTKRQLMERCSFVRLPSSSPIPTKYHRKWADKLDEWRIILKYLDGEEK